MKTAQWPAWRNLGDWREVGSAAQIHGTAIDASTLKATAGLTGSTRADTK